MGRWPNAQHEAQVTAANSRLSLVALDALIRLGYYLVFEVHASLIVAFADFPFPFFTTVSMSFFSAFFAFIIFSLFENVLTTNYHLLL